MANRRHQPAMSAPPGLWKLLDRGELHLVRVDPLQPSTKKRAPRRAQLHGGFAAESNNISPISPDALHARFRNHTTKLFEKHGMTNVGYWKPLDEPLSKNTLIYVLAYPNREAAKKAWEGFRKDPEWLKAKEASEVNGVLTAKVDSIYMEATDYSALK